jgi:hypothetical protein
MAEPTLANQFLSDELVAYIWVLARESNNVVLYDTDLQIEPALLPPPNLIPTRKTYLATEDSSCDSGDTYDFQLGPGEALPCGMGVKMHTMSLTTLDVRRWTLAANGAREMHSRPLVGAASQEIKINLSYMLGQRMPNANHMVSFGMLSDSSHVNDSSHITALDTDNLTLEVLVLFGIVPVVYGALNLAGLSYEFASPLERRLWMVACGSIMGLELPAMLILEYSDRRMSWALNFASLVVLVFCCVCFGMARLYLVVESFCSLRDVSAGTYVTVNWLRGIPHL